MDDAQCSAVRSYRDALAVPRYFLSRPAEIIQLLNIRLFSNPDIRIRRKHRVFEWPQVHPRDICPVQIERASSIVLIVR